MAYTEEEDFTNAQNNHGGITNADARDNGAGTEFVAASTYTLTRVETRLERVGSPTKDLVCEIWDKSGTTPNTLLGRSLNVVNSADVPTSPAGQFFIFNDIAIASGSSYFVTVRTVDSSYDVSNYVRWKGVSTATGIDIVYNGGSGWSVWANDWQFSMKTFSGAHELSRDDVLFWLPGDNSVLEYKNNKEPSTAATVTIGDSETPTGMGIGSFYNDLTLNGKIRYTSLSHANTTWSISAWVKTSASGDQFYLIDFNTGGDRTIIQIDTSGDFQHYDGTAWRSSGFTINDDAWHHVVVVRSGTAYTFYVDGSSSGGTGTARQLNGAFGFMASELSSAYWVGNAKELVIFNRALSAAEVSDLYNSGSGKTWTDYFSLTDDLVQHLSLESAATDDTDVGNDAAVTGGSYVTGLLGNGYDLARTGDYIDVLNGGTFSSTTSWTRSWWVNIDSYDGGGSNQRDYMYDSLNSGETLRCLVAANHSGQIAIYEQSNGWSDLGTNTTYLPVDSWHHVVLVADGTTFKLYVDGSQLGSDVTGGEAFDISVATEMVHGAGKGTKTNDDMDAIFDQVSCYERALTAGEVKRLYNYGAGRTYAELSNGSPLLEGLRDYWSFDSDNTSSRGYENSGSTVTGATHSSTDGPIGGHYSFDGTGDKIAMTPAILDSIAEGGFQIWSRFDNESASYNLYGAAVSGAAKFRAQYETTLDDWYCYVYADATTDPFLYTEVSPHDWTAWTQNGVSWTTTGTSKTVYVDGAASATNTGTGTRSAHSSFELGTNGVNASDDLIGDLAAMALWTREVTVADMNALYNSGAGFAYPFSTAVAAVPRSAFFFGGGI